MSKKILIRNATIINEGRSFRGSLLIEGEQIAGIAEGDDLPAGSGARVIDAGGQWLLPGIIDEHVHFRDPGFPQKADFASESAAAVAGGVTTVMDMPNTSPQTVTLDLLEEKFRMASVKSLVNYSFWLGATHDNLEEVKKVDPTRVCGIKVFMGSSTGNMLLDNPDLLAKIFAQAPVLVGVHAEDDGIIRKNLKRYEEEFGINIPFPLHPEIRPAEACYRSSSAAIELARLHGTRLHILHLSTAEELALLDNKTPLREKQITAEACLPHLLFSAEDYYRLGSRIKVNPAIKTEDDQTALLEGLANDRLDTIATDHAPHAWPEKAKPYLLAPSGTPMVQHSLPAMLEYVKGGKIAPEKVVDKMCHAPAEIFGIHKRGFLREGYMADLVLVDPDFPWTVEKKNILYKCGWSALEGIRLTMRITHTFVNGRLVYEHGAIDTSFRGKALTFDR